MRRVNKSERVRIALTLNGRKLAAEAEARTLLSDFLRHSLGATGTMSAASTASAAPAPSSSTASRRAPASRSRCRPRAAR